MRTILYSITQPSSTAVTLNNQNLAAALNSPFHLAQRIVKVDAVTEAPSVRLLPSSLDKMEVGPVLGSPKPQTKTVEKMRQHRD